MELVLLYGLGLVSKRNQLVKIKASFNGEDITTVDVKSEGIERLFQLIQAVPMFSTGARLVVAENIPDSLDLVTLPEGEGSLTVLLVADSPRADSKIISSAKKNKVKLIQFEAEKEVTAFPYVDSLLEGKKIAFVELEKLLKEYGGMYTLSMIYYGLRRNLLPSPPSSFMRQKVESQKDRFKESDWQRLYKLTLETESDIKSGKTDEKLGLFRLTQEFVTN